MPRGMHRWEGRGRVTPSASEHHKGQNLVPTCVGKPLERRTEAPLEVLRGKPNSRGVAELDKWKDNKVKSYLNKVK